MADSTHGSEQVQSELGASCCVRKERSTHKLMKACEKDKEAGVTGLSLAKPRAIWTSELLLTKKYQEKQESDYCKSHEVS